MKKFLSGTFEENFLLAKAKNSEQKESKPYAHVSTNPLFPDVTLSISPDKVLPSGWTLVLLIYMMMLEAIEVIEDDAVPQQAH